MLNKVTPLDAPSVKEAPNPGPRAAPSPVSAHVTGPHPPFDPAEMLPPQTDAEAARPSMPGEREPNDPNAKS